LPVFMLRVSVSRFALHAGLVSFRQTFVLRCLGGKLPPAGGKEPFLPTRAASSSSPTAGRCLLNAHSGVGPDAPEPDLPLIAWPVSYPLTGREMRGTLQSREGPARQEWLQLGPSTGSILPFERRAGSHRAAGTCSSVNDQQGLAAVQVLSGPRHGKTRIGSFCPTHLS
jgi:hypothetical protein